MESQQQEHEKQEQHEQQQPEERAAVPEDYLDAQRAAVEAIEVGRATLEEANRQGEQLSYAEKLADDTKSALEKSSRLLRGMTWSGWVQNMFSKEIIQRSGSSQIEYDEVPPFAQPAAQSIQNYQANLAVLEACETDEQRITCKLVCDDMFRSASQKIEGLSKENNPGVIRQLSFDLQRLRARQNDFIDRCQETGVKGICQKGGIQQIDSDHSALSSVQNDHLNFLAGNLDELSTMAFSLNETFARQTKIVNSLEEKTEENYEKTKMVSRKANWIAQKKSWTTPKKNFEKWITIRHVHSNKYIANVNGSLALLQEFDRQSCVFGVWVRPNGLFGLRSKLSDRFVGQTLLGSLSCTSSSFGHREEWQADEDWEKSRLLSASANWGTGGYLTVTPRQGLKFVKIEDKAFSSLWSLSEI